MTENWDIESEMPRDLHEALADFQRSLATENARQDGHSDTDSPNWTRLIVAQAFQAAYHDWLDHRRH